MADPISINILGYEYIKKLLDGLDARLQRQVIRPAFKRVGAQMLADAQAAVPSATGNLRESLEVKVSITKKGASAKVITRGEKDGTFYGAFVELGTHRQRPQPFLRPALDAEHKANYREMLAQGIAEEIKKRV